MENQVKNPYKLVEWDPKFEIGVPVIDAQHKRLIELCNHLYSTLMNDRNLASAKWRETFAAAVVECVNYCLTHFRDEEVLQKAAGYEGYVGHKKRHDEFVAKVKETVASINKATVSDCLNFIKFLRDWILSHIACEDKLFAKTVAEYLATVENLQK